MLATAASFLPENRTKSTFFFFLFNFLISSFFKLFLNSSSISTTGLEDKSSFIIFSIHPPFPLIQDPVHINHLIYLKYAVPYSSPFKN
jgi:hypothetical protein